MRAILATAVVPPLLTFTSFARLERALSTAARWSRAGAPDDQYAANWVDGVLDRLPNPWLRTCLRRASVLYYLLLSAGRSVELCIGVRKDTRGELHAHAWLLLDGAIYLEPANTRDVASQFQEIARFPSVAK
ncbi:MAG: hypothetical protein JWM95_5116 [Gemmatimonadetes bacterium]|nr:hypothetical protein [Gemmatimonadota bacterium]